MTKWLAVAVAVLSSLLGLACGARSPELVLPGPAPDAHQEHDSQRGSSRPPEAEEARLIHRLMADTERIRGLRFRAPIDVRIQDRVAMRAYVSGAIEEEDLVRARRRYVALGLIDPSLDVRELLESLMEEELIGYYDPKKKQLAVRDDVARVLGHEKAEPTDLEWRATVVHELVHALQDQHLDLAAAMERERTTDADNAFGALVEGDATFAMLGYAANLVGVTLTALAADPTGLSAALHAGPDRLTGALRRAPAIVREPLLFRYRGGALFAAKLYATGGWESVNAAHRAPPDSTLSVDEPGRFLAHGPEPAIRPLELDWLSRHGYRASDEDVLGSFESGVAFGLKDDVARSLQRAWRGDRYVVFEHGKGEVASVWCLRFDTRGNARRASSALMNMPDYGARRFVSSDGTYVLAIRGVTDAAAVESIDKEFHRWAREEP